MYLKDLRLGYRGGPDVVEVTQERVDAGELICLVGPNGGGKTTLLKSIAGLLRPRAGNVLLDDRPLYGHHCMTRDERARRLAVVLTDRITPAYLRVRELVSLARIPHYRVGNGHGRGFPDHDAIVDRALNSTGVMHLANRPAGRLSDGERQRVMISRALAQEPSILLLDEPTAHLDPPHQTELFLLLRNLVDRGRIQSAVVATHHLHLALHFAHRVFLVARTVRASGAPESLLATGAVAATFPDTGNLHLDPLRGWFTPSNS